jgi:hypothetical protein
VERHFWVGSKSNEKDGGTAEGTASESEEIENARKIKFAAMATSLPVPEKFGPPRVDAEIWDILEWMANHSPQEVNMYREQATQRIEQLAEEYTKAGDVQAWFANADPGVKRVAAGVNGPLMEHLIKETGFTDTTCAELFREGGSLVGVLEPIAGCNPKLYPDPDDPESVRATAAAANSELIGTIRQDQHADFLMAQTLEDAALGRMTEPVKVSAVSTDTVRLARRFSREQGTKPDGSVKLRAVDDETASGTNGATQPTTKMTTDSIDMLVEIALLIMTFTELGIGFWKADIDAAFRRIPIKPEHRWLAWIVFAGADGVYAAGHLAMPFGAIAAVHAWERVGAFFRHIARRILKLPALRFVDDFFAADRKDSVGTAKNCLARIVRAILGPTALAARKLEHGNPLVMLGLSAKADRKSIRITPSKEKVDHWSHVLETALESGIMAAGDASKCAGRFQFAARGCFRMLGRAMVRPFYAQQYSPLQRGAMGPLLVMACQWWMQVLRGGISEEISKEKPSKVV